MTPGPGTVVPPCGCCGEVWAWIGELAFDSLRWKGDVVMFQGDVTSGLGVLFLCFLGPGVNTLSSIIMEDVEVENWSPKWKESNTGDTPIFHFHDDWRKGNLTLKIERCPNDTKDYCKSDDDSILVGGFSHPFEKYAQVKFHHFPRDRDENKYCLKPRRNEICINFFYLSIFTVMKGKGNLYTAMPLCSSHHHTMSHRSVVDWELQRMSSDGSSDGFQSFTGDRANTRQPLHSGNSNPSWEGKYLHI